MLRKGDIIDLEIASLAFGGEGVGRISLDSEHKKPFVVFVPDTVPGDKVQVKITHIKKNLAKGFVISFIEQSALRIKPRCKHFGKAKIFASSEASPFDNKQKNCGGCAWQFLSYEKQLEFKTQQVRESLERLGGIDGSVVRPAIGMKEPWYYRNKMEFSFSKNAEGKLTLGLHMKGRHHDVTEIEECFLMRPYIGELVKRCREFFQKEIQFEKGNNLELKSLTIRQGINTGEIMVNLTAENGQADFLEKFVNFIRAFFEHYAKSKQQNSAEQTGNQLAQSDILSSPPEKLVSVYFTHIFNQKGYRKSFQEELLWGEKFFHETLRLEQGSELKFQIAPQVFFQPNTKQAERLYQLVLEACELTGKETVYDLFCGTGTIGIFCAAQAKQVMGIELNPDAIVNARQNAQTNNVENIEFLVGDVHKILPQLGKKTSSAPNFIQTINLNNSPFTLNDSAPDTVIVDPPRAGLQKETIEAIVQSPTKKIVYVSCNPTALARDLKLFTEGGFKVNYVQPVDQFCHTYHIECVAKLTKIN